LADEAEIDTRQLQPVRTSTPGDAGAWRANVMIAGFMGLVAFFLFAMPAILGRPLCETPEARVAVAAREMIVRDNYLVPYMGEEARVNKPPLPYWVAAYTARLFDSSAGPQKPPSQQTLAHAVEFPSALASAFAVFLVTLYGASVFSRTAGLLAGLMLSCSALVAAYSFRGYGDTQLMAFTAMALCGAAWIVTAPTPGFFGALVFGIGLGLAVLVKGQIPLFIVAAPLLAEVILRRTFNGRKVALTALGLLIAAAIAVPWFLMVEKAHPGSWNKMMWEVKDAAAAVTHNKDDRWVFYLYKLPGALLPWTPVLLFGWAYFLTRGRKQSDPQQPPEKAALYCANLRFMALAAGLGFIGFYAVNKQQDYYLLPILPPLLLASGAVLAHFRFPGGRAEEGLAWSQLLLGVFLAGAVASVPAWLPQAVKGNEARAAVDTFLNATGWAVTIPVGIAILLLHLALARQWVEGRALTAGLIFGAAAYAALFAFAVHWTNRVNHDTTLALESARLREELGRYGKDARIYGAGTDKAKLVLYLERPVADLRDIRLEEAEAAPPERILVISRADLEKLGPRLGLSATAPQGQDYMLVPLSSDKDWAQLIETVLSRSLR